MGDIRLRFVERLSDGDLAALGTAAEPMEVAALRTRLRLHPTLLDQLLSAPEVYQRVFSEPGFLTGLTPRLVFGVMVHRAAAELDEATFVAERVAPGRRLPVFDVGPLRELVGDPDRRIFLTELLASFTRVSGGVKWERTPRGMRRRRYSELDPFHLAEVLETVPALRRPAVLRRMGDVALFLVGVLPEATASRRPSPPQVERLARTAGVEPLAALEVLAGDDGMLGLLEVTGTRWYRSAGDEPGFQLLHDVADRFPTARRFLGYLADRYLHHIHTDWMPRQAG